MTSSPSLPIEPFERACTFDREHGSLVERLNDGRVPRRNQGNADMAQQASLDRLITDLYSLLDETFRTVHALISTSSSSMAAEGP